MFDSEKLKKGSSSTLHVLPEADPEQMAQTLVSFANSDGGTLVIGVKPDGEIVGQTYNEDIEKSLQKAEELCNPPVVVGTWEQIDVDNKAVVAIRVPRSIELHAMSDGRVLVRRNGENR